MNFKLSSIYCILSSEYVKQIKYRNCEYTKLGLLIVPDTLKSARVNLHILPHNLSNMYVKEDDQVSADFTSNLFETFLSILGRLDLMGTLTWGRFDVHTD